MANLGPMLHSYFDHFNLFSLERWLIRLYAIGLMVLEKNFDILLRNNVRDIHNICIVLSRIYLMFTAAVVLKKWPSFQS